MNFSCLVFLFFVDKKYCRATDVNLTSFPSELKLKNSLIWVKVFTLVFSFLLHLILHEILLI